MRVPNFGRDQAHPSLYFKGHCRVFHPPVTIPNKIPGPTQFEPRIVMQLSHNYYSVDQVSQCRPDARLYLKRPSVRGLISNFR